jgi:biotin carboxylase
MQVAAARNIVERGFHLVVTDRNPDCACAPLASTVVPLDTFDIQGHLAAARTLSRTYSIRAVLTAAADCHETVAHVAKSLGLPAVSPEIAHLCRYKHLTREALTRAGLPQPRFLVVSSLVEARDAVAAWGGSAVVKATNNSGSRGFTAIHHPSELTEEVLACAVEAGTTGFALLEEMLVPVRGEMAEQSVETLWHNGSMYWLNWVDRLFREDFRLFESLREGTYDDVSWGVELGHVNPAIHGVETKREVAAMVHRAGAALGMTRLRGGHILKADIMLTTAGPRIVELTPRLSGGWDSSLSTPARGADFVGGVVGLALGESLSLRMWYRHFHVHAPELCAAVLASVERGARDCLGRRFALGTDLQRERAIQKALTNLHEERHVTPMVQ